MKIVCKHCGKTRSEHCEFEAQMPEGCVCDPLTWGHGDDSEVNPVCDKFEPLNDSIDTVCRRCEHDLECHKK